MRSSITGLSCDQLSFSRSAQQVAGWSRSLGGWRAAILSRSHWCCLSPRTSCPHRCPPQTGHLRTNSNRRDQKGQLLGSSGRGSYHSGLRRPRSHSAPGHSAQKCSAGGRRVGFWADGSARGPVLQEALLQYLAAEESFPVSLLLLHQFEDRLVAPHLPAAALSIDASLELQVGSVPPSVCSATEDVRRPCQDQALRAQTGPLNHSHKSCRRCRWVLTCTPPCQGRSGSSAPLGSAASPSPPQSPGSGTRAPEGGS